MLGAQDVEMVDSVDDLESSQSVRGHRFPNFEMLDAKFASSLKKIIQNFYVKKEVNLAEHRFVRERQIAFMMCDCFRVTGAHEAALDYSDLLRVSSHGDDVEDFDTRWDQVYDQGKNSPKTVFWYVCMRCEYESPLNSKQYWQLAVYEQEVNQNLTQPNLSDEDHGDEVLGSKDQSPKF